MASGKTLRSSGTESRVHSNDHLLCHDVLDRLGIRNNISPRILRLQNPLLVTLTYHIIPCVSGMFTRSTTIDVVDMMTL